MKDRTTGAPPGAAAIALVRSPANPNGRELDLRSAAVQNAVISSTCTVAAIAKDLVAAIALHLTASSHLQSAAAFPQTACTCRRAEAEPLLYLLLRRSFAQSSRSEYS
jgi:hypothetical protein